MRKKQKIKEQPDEIFSCGLFSIARYGKNVFIQNNATEDEIEKLKMSFEQNYTPLVQEMDKDVTELVGLVVSYPPCEILQNGYWNLYKTNGEQKGEADDRLVLARRGIDYVQSLIVSNTPCLPYKEFTEDVREEIEALVEKIFTFINQVFPLIDAAHRKKTGECLSDEKEKERLRGLFVWCNVRGRRYRVFEGIFLRALLLPQNDVISKTFGISAENLICELEKIQHKLCAGISDFVRGLRVFEDASISKIEERCHDESGFNNLLPREQMKIILAENKWEEWGDSIIQDSSVLGLGLFQINKYCNFPNAFLSAFSYAPGEEKAFCAPGGYSGWPLQKWPIMRKPFLCYENNYYCFDLSSLFDNFYRNLYHAIVEESQDDKTIRDMWNKTQNQITEDLPIIYLQKLLPEATILRNIFYDYCERDGTKKKRCEVDAIVLYLDTLLVVEVKAGAFSPNSPNLDFEAYEKSLDGLIIAPALQGVRFLTCLEDTKSVVLKNEQGDVLQRLASETFTQTGIVTVSLDVGTNISANISSRFDFKGKNIKYPIWPVSIEDMMVFCECFDNPLQFLHFLKIRWEAFFCENMNFADELDHLGLYFEYNNYVKYAAQNGDGGVTWNGFTKELDDYFEQKAFVPTLNKKFIQKNMGKRLVEIIKVLSLMKDIKRGVVGRILLDMETSARNNVEMVIEEWISTARSYRFAHNSGTSAISIYCQRKDGVCYDDERLLRQSKIAMLKYGEDSRLLLRLLYDGDLLCWVSWEFLDRRNISEEENSRLRAFLVKADERRVCRHIETMGKIQRNERCPCGSGLKYKKCCLNKRNQTA